VIANGDIHDCATAREALAQSGAHGVMIGRAAMGQPWLLGEIAANLSGKIWQAPSLETQVESLCEQISDSQQLYGAHQGLRVVRKHVSAFIDKVDLAISPETRRRLRSELCQLGEARILQRRLRGLISDLAIGVAA
ncbi:MAG: tRNA-dihydrouridine synthase, partial [Pseudomonadota bacterium]